MATTASPLPTTIVAPAAAMILPRPAVAAVVIGGSALAALALPLWTYSTGLAVLGTAHVATELRFVEARFATRMGPRLFWAMASLLLCVATIRLLKLLELWGGTPAVRLELGLVAALGALVLPALARAGRGPALAGLALIAALTAGVALWPGQTLLLLAVLHNWTPVGFLADGLPARERPAGRMLGLLAFVLVPLVLASGLPGQAMAALGAGWPELRWLPTGPLSRHLGAYLPEAWHAAPWALPLFSAVVFTQCMHYATVIGVLPRLAPGGPRAPAVFGLSRVPRALFVGGVLALTLIGLWGYADDFSDTRRWYGLIAAVHAWIEVPVLMLALFPMIGRPAIGRPAAEARPT